MGCEALATKAELEALRSQLNNKLDKSEKQSIVESAINTIKSLPLGAFAFGATVASSGDLLNALTRVEAVEGQTRRVATFLHNRTANAINQAEIAAAQARRAEAASAVARQEALSALGKAAEALGRIAVIASALAALGISLGTLFTLGNRIDALEQYLDSVASGLSNALSTALQALGLGRENKTEINTLNQTTNYLKDITSATERDLRKAESNIENLGANLASANASIQKLNREMGSANAEISHLSKEISSANTKISTLSKDLNTLASTVGKLESDLYSANAEVSKLSGGLNSAKAEISRVVSGINSANAKNQSISNDLKTANDRIRQNAETSASAQNAATANRQEITNLNNEVKTGIVVKSWSPTVWQPVITNSYTQLRSEVRNISVQEASNQIQKTFADVSNDIQSKLNTSDFQKALQQDAGLQDLRRRLGTVETKTASMPTVTSQTTSTSTPILTSDVSSLKDRISQQERTTTNLQTRISEQERVNSTAVTMLGGISSKLDGLPLATAGLVTPYIPTTNAIETAAAAGTCRTTRPGGCMANQFQNIQNGQNDLLNKVNLGLQSGQGFLLTQINNGVSLLNTKVGDIPLAGGMTGALSNAFSFLNQSRFMEVVTLIGVMHNALMLSNNVESTLFSIIDNLINTGIMIVNPDGQLVQSQSWVGKKVDEYFGVVLGAKTWESIKTEWKELNSIYSTGANLLGNVQSIIGDTQNIQNITNGWVAQLGNALQNEGLIGENNWQQKPEEPKFKSSKLAKIQQMAEGIQEIDTALQAINAVTQSLQNIVQQGNEIKKNLSELDTEKNKAIETAMKVHQDLVDKIELPLFDTDDLF